MLKNYQELKVWERAYQLCLQIYKLVRDFPVEERYGLSLQLRRSAVSIPSNIAEGYGRKTRGEYVHHLYIAYGSYCELETQLLLAIDLNYIKEKEREKILESGKEVERMLKALIDSLERKPLNPLPHEVRPILQPIFSKIDYKLEEKELNQYTLGLIIIKLNLNSNKIIQKCPMKKSLILYLSCLI